MESASHRSNFPVVEQSTLSYYSELIGWILIGISLFPEASWLSVLLAPLLLFCSPLIFVGVFIFDAVIVVLGGPTAGATFTLFCLIVVICYLLLIFIAFFGEIILIPWALLSLPALGIGGLSLYISSIS